MGREELALTELVRNRHGLKSDIGTAIMNLARSVLEKWSDSSTARVVRQIKDEAREA